MVRLRARAQRLKSLPHAGRISAASIALLQKSHEGAARCTFELLGVSRPVIVGVGSFEALLDERKKFILVQSPAGPMPISVIAIKSGRYRPALDVSLLTSSDDSMENHSSKEGRLKVAGFNQLTKTCRCHHHQAPPRCLMFARTRGRLVCGLTATAGNVSMRSGGTPMTVGANSIVLASH
jgi:hypothetical protein